MSAAVYMTVCRAVLVPSVSTTGSTGKPARSYSSRKSHASARKCGICHRNTIANSSHASRDTVPVAAAQPITGGSAPGIAPTIVASEERRFIGVYQTT